MAPLIIFDCDGVLIDSEIIAARAHSDALAALGCPIGLEELLLRFTGIPDREMYPVVEAEWGRRLPDDYDASVVAAVERAYRTELRPVDGIQESLGRVSNPVCVASSSSPAKIELGLRLTGLHERFAPNIFSAAQVARGKPAPDLFLFAANQMGFDPSDCIVVEDSVAGVRAARAAGMTAIGFNGASHCREGHAERLQREGAREVIADIRRLPDLIAGLAR